ncbi:SGNH/GDSL hydrolase family protein [Rugosimonospora africana]|uniref:SGNH hydrolase n=1 Tax=Rugosimonospora africana TaxID=556532 RepID=A0A8J3VNU1_9ACTN|nr:SGNH/GDSL hydrolase family protein [Rugosimonospora africana]GIH13242.1 SGNH hydrolase [Rugosimonospora africana]
MGWGSFVAIGDSFTEGMDDLYPDGTLYRGWADLVAQRLAEDQPGFGYANLAIRGRLFDRIVDEQVPIALRVAPDLVSFAAGGNDVLRRNFDGPALTKRLDDVIRALRATGADVIVFRFADVTRRLPGRRLVLPRAAYLNSAIGETARRHGARLIDLWQDEEFYSPLLWSVDRLHLNEVGHRRVAAHVLTALDVKPDPAWWDVPPPGPVLSWVSRRAADTRWARQYFAPWIKRRLTGRSSGDHVVAKRPTLSPLD